MIQINLSIDHCERDTSAWCSSAHKIRCLKKLAVRNTKEVAEKQEGLTILFSSLIPFFLFLIDGIRLHLKGVTAQMSHCQKEGMVQWRNRSAFPADTAGYTKLVGEIIHWLRGFPQNGHATGYVIGKNTGCATALRRLSCCPLQAEHSCRNTWRARDAVCGWDVGECWEGHIALGPLEGMSLCPAGDVWRGRSLWELKAAISPQWKAGSVSVVRAEEKKAWAGAKHAWLPAVLQCSCCWAHSG